MADSASLLCRFLRFCRRLSSLRLSRGCRRRAMSGSLQQENLCHLERAAGCFCSSAVIHERKALLRHFAQKDFPGTAIELVRVNLGCILPLLLVAIVILSITVAIPTALAAAVTAALITAHYLRHGKSGHRVGLTELCGGLRYIHFLTRSGSLLLCNRPGLGSRRSCFLCRFGVFIILLLTALRAGRFLRSR